MTHAVYCPQAGSRGTSLPQSAIPGLYTFHGVSPLRHAVLPTVESGMDGPKPVLSIITRKVNRQAEHSSDRMTHLGPFGQMGMMFAELVVLEPVLLVLLGAYVVPS